MKKLIMMLGVALVGLMTQAATCAWSGSSIAKNGSAAATDYTMYLIDSTVLSSDTLRNALASGDTTALTGEAVVRTANGAAQGANVRWSASGWGDFTAGTEYSYYSVILNGSLEDATAFMMTETLTKTVPATGALNMGFGSQASNTWSEVVPEPTTGLLMLIGLAGLALRRKQA